MNFHKYIDIYCTNTQLAVNSFRQYCVTARYGVYVADETYKAILDGYLKGSEKEASNHKEQERRRTEEAKRKEDQRKTKEAMLDVERRKAEKAKLEEEQLRSEEKKRGAEQRNNGRTERNKEPRKPAHTNRFRAAAERESKRYEERRQPPQVRPQVRPQTGPQARPQARRNRSTRITDCDPDELAAFLNDMPQVEVPDLASAWREECKAYGLCTHCGEKLSFFTNKCKACKVPQ